MRNSYATLAISHLRHFSLPLTVVDKRHWSLEHWSLPGPSHASPCAARREAPTMLGAKQAVEDLLHHDGVEFDELGQGLDHLFLRGWGAE